MIIAERQAQWNEGLPGETGAAVLDDNASRGPASTRVSPAGSTRPGAWLDALVVIGDASVLLSSFALLTLAFTDVKPDPWHMGLWCLGLVAAWLLAGNRSVYRSAMLARPLESAYVAGKVTLITGAIFYLLPLLGGGSHSRIDNIVVTVILAAAMSVWRMALARILRFPMEELIVVGAGWAGQALAEALARSAHPGIRLAALVDADPKFIGRTIHGIRVEPVDRLSQLARDTRQRGSLARVVLANTGHAHEAVFDQLVQLAQAGVDVVQMSTIYEQVTGRIPVRHLGDYWWAMLPRPSTALLYWAIKRTIDLMLSLCGLLVLASLLPILWIVLPRQTGGSLFFSQLRVGKHNRSFTVRKLRTLATSAAVNSTDWTARKASNRPTPLCALIRSIGLDELPQLVNVLRGDMSLIGPRPYVPDEVDDLQRQIPFFRCRALVRPGITGWAQINYGYGLSLEDEVEKLQYDLYYIGRQSLYLDLLIIVRTCLVALRGRRPNSRVSLSALPKRGLYADFRTPATVAD